MTIRNISEKARKIEHLLETKQPNWDKRIWKLASKCFNEIFTTNNSLGGGPFFDLTENWALLKNKDYESVLANIKRWLEEVDCEYDIVDEDQTIFAPTCSEDGKVTIHIKGIPEILKKLDDKEDVKIEVNLKCI